jgi:hypothetical protein
MTAHVHRWSRPYVAVDGNEWRECYGCHVTEQIAVRVVEPWGYGLDLLNETKGEEQ